MLSIGFKRIAIGALALAAALMFMPGSQARAARMINGAGATFPYPVYSKWAKAYNKVTGVELNYQAIGSGGGIAQIKAKTVDFGASDVPLTKEQLDQIGLIQWPMIMGGVVPVLNVPGIKAGELHLSGATLADIYLGKITHWDAAEIKAENRHLQLPHRAITVVHRSDGSGTTWIYTNYLDKVSGAWHEKVGTDKSVDWPVGVGGKGNQGVAAYVQRIKGSIGYVEYAYALQNHMTYAKLKNRAGYYVSPTSRAFEAAAANADWPNAPGFYLVLTDQPGATSWPITGASFILFYKTQKHPETAREVLKFLDWGYHYGQKMAESLDYVPIPMNVVKLVEAKWSSTLRTASGDMVWTDSMPSR